MSQASRLGNLRVCAVLLQWGWLADAKNSAGEPAMSPHEKLMAEQYSLSMQPQQSDSDEAGKKTNLQLEVRYNSWVG